MSPDAALPHERAAILQRAEQLALAAYGEAPPAPAQHTSSLRHRAEVARWHGAWLETWRLAWPGPAAGGLTLQLARPGPQPPRSVLVSGDACWPYLSEAMVTAALQRGLAWAWFNRTEVAADPPAGAADATAPGDSGEASDGASGALAWWAWALQQAAAAVRRMPDMCGVPVGGVGHSRGGKAALLAGARDASLAFVIAHNSGTLGAASSRVAGPGSETVAQLVGRFPHWVGPRLRAAAKPEEALPFDQDALLAALAPRPVLLTQSRDDAWANPAGTQHVVQQVQPLWAAAGAALALQVQWRQGGHAPEDGDGVAWVAFVSALTA